MAEPVVTKKSKKSKKTQAAAEPESAAQQAAQAVPLQPKPVAAISVNTNGGLLSSKKKHKKRKAPEEEQPLPAAKAAEPQAAAETEEQPNKKRKKQKTPAAPEPSSNQDLAKAAAADGASTALTGLLEVQAQLPTADAMPAGTSSTKKKRKKAKTAAAMPSAPSTPAQPDIPASAPEATPGLPEPSLADSPADGKKKKKKRKSSAAEVPSAAAADEPTAVITTTVTSTGPDSAQAVSTSVVVPKSAVKEVAVAQKEKGKQQAARNASGRAFQRVVASEWLDKEGATDNSYQATFGDSGWGAKAQERLGQVRGKDFRHEKTKKKRGGYRGGVLDIGTRSQKFVYDDDDE